MKNLTSCLIIVTLLIFVGCTGERGTKTVRVAVSLAGDDTAFTTLVLQELMNAADEHNLQLDWRIAHRSPDIQSENIDELLLERPEVTIIELVDPEEGGKLIERITSAGSRVIAFNRPPSRSQVDLFVSSDYRRIGSDMALAALESTEKDPLYITVFTGDESSASDKLITRGILEVLHGGDKPTGITQVIITEKRSGEAGARIMDLIGSAEHKTDFILCVSDEITKVVFEGILAVINTQNLSPHAVPSIVGIEYGEDPPQGYPEVITIDRMPFKTGILLAEAAGRLGRGEIRHVEGKIFQSGNYVFPVIYTPHKINRR
jgi:ABC-type sugar transport system substrate-binding protein